jgi:glyoxylase-like metal-dependent hydrolase (beta-lactamase superfamily II)
MPATTPAHQSIVHTLDLNFLGIPGSIAAYLIPHAHGAILIETGPGSTLPALQAGLRAHGLLAADISDVFLTHIHLDHAGAAGWLARQGAQIHVHPLGAPHLIDPERLLNSASRIYGDKMDFLWGEFLPVPEEQLSVLQDGESVEIDGLRIRAIDTPGHAYHHYIYILEDICFSGDIGGVRMPGVRHVRLPMPPPELHLESWRASLKKMRQEYENGSFTRIAPTHFGIFDDPAWHLAAIQEYLDDVETFILRTMPSDPPLETINQQFLSWTKERSARQGLTEQAVNAFEAANPSWMSPAGIQRYWRKYHQPQN